jgi:hypothetical protein
VVRSSRLGERHAGLFVQADRGGSEMHFRPRVLVGPQPVSPCDGSVDDCETQSCSPAGWKETEPRR